MREVLFGRHFFTHLCFLCIRSIFRFITWLDQAIIFVEFEIYTIPPPHPNIGDMWMFSSYKELVTRRGTSVLAIFFTVWERKEGMGATTSCLPINAYW